MGAPFSNLHHCPSWPGACMCSRTLLLGVTDWEARGLKGLTWYVSLHALSLGHRRGVKSVEFKRKKCTYRESSNMSN